MRRLLGIASALLVVLLSDGRADELIVVVDDQNGRRLADAVVTALLHPVGGRMESQIARTDADGSATIVGDFRLGFSLVCERQGHYPARFDHVPPRERIKLNVILPEVVNPIPLYACHKGRDWAGVLEFPVEEDWVGFDLAVSDWVAPYGRGVISDLKFWFSKKFLGYRSTGESLERALRLSKAAAAQRGESWNEEEFRKSAGAWEGTLRIASLGKKEGIIELQNRYVPYNRLKLQHLAPESGYISRIQVTANTLDPNSRSEVGYFLRTRVKLDEAGEIVSANYAKIYGEFVVDPRGSVSFLYYFNPTPNDRNLEFDPSRNLFPPDFPGADVRDP